MKPPFTWGQLAGHTLGWGALGLLLGAAPVAVAIGWIILLFGVLFERRVTGGL